MDDFGVANSVCGTPEVNFSLKQRFSAWRCTSVPGELLKSKPGLPSGQLK